MKKNNYIRPATIMLAFLLAGLFLITAPISGFTQNGGEVRLSFIHWNDFHAANISYEIRPAKKDRFQSYFVGGSAILKSYIDSLKKANVNPTVVFAGDDFQGSPISTFTRGQSQIDLMKIIKPDVLTIGNHEFDYGSSRFKDMIRSSSLNYVSSNLYYHANDSLYVPAYWIREIDGVRMVFIGGITDELLKLSLPVNVSELSTKSVYSTVASTMQTVRQISGEPDLWIVVSHCGIEQDTAMARMIPEIDLIIGGHTHTYLFEEVRIGRTSIVQAGARGRYIGEIKLTYSKKEKSISDFRYKLIETSSCSMIPDSLIASMVAKQESMIGQELDLVIGELKVDWKIPRSNRESNLGSFEADIFREFAGTDIAFMNNGGLRKELPAGPIRVRDVWEINPFNNTLVMITVKGSQLIPMIDYSIHNAESFVQISGMSYTAKKSSDKKYTIADMKIGGNPVDPTREYTIAMNNYMALQIDNIFGLKKDEHPIRDFGVSDRELIISAIKTRKTIDQETDGRIKFLE